MNNNFLDNNNNRGCEILDILSILSFSIQLNNIAKDEKQTKYIQDVILALAHEIELLHKENDILIAQNKEILDFLKKDKKGEE